jgi:catechol 2,3-dioxygenase-like lactoylglutathione lyase family enzyme
MERSQNGNQLAGGVVIYAANLDRLRAFYRATLGLHDTTGDASHVVLEAHQFQVVLLRGDPPSDPGPIVTDRPAERRSAVAIKPVFVVASLAPARAAAARTGGVINPERHEWRFGAYRACDGVDPEGNVIQLREWIPEAPSEADGREGP